MSTIKDRIKLIMSREQLTAGAFAENIGVAQATISHILGERNKYPSTDFILRLHQRYADINLDWLLTGKGTMTCTDIDSETPKTEDYPLFGKMTNAPTDRGLPDKELKLSVNNDMSCKEKPQRKITEIRVFFDDNTYEIFKPEK